MPQKLNDLIVAANFCEVYLAKEAGAQSVQIGSAFAYCAESGIENKIKETLISKHFNGGLKIHTDFQASPTGYPFKIVDNALDVETLMPSTANNVCDLGYLREVMLNTEGKIEFRCPAENPKNYLRKGGTLEETLGRQCLCNGLMATAGMAQVRKNTQIKPFLTAGTNFNFLNKLTNSKECQYRAKEVIDLVLQPA